METIFKIPRNPLFFGMTAEEANLILSEYSARLVSFEKGAFVLRAGEPAGTIGILRRGSAQVLREDFTGNRTIVARLEPGDLFGEAFAFAGVGRLTVGVMAVEQSDILLLRYKKAAEVSPAARGVAARLEANLGVILARKNVLLNHRIEILSERSTRDKLIAYLSAQAQQAGGPDFTIPFDRQELADYLCVERSAMSAALSRLQRDGLLEYHKNHFVLHARQEEDR